MKIGEFISIDHVTQTITDIARWEEWIFVKASLSNTVAFHPDMSLEDAKKFSVDVKIVTSETEGTFYSPSFSIPLDFSSWDFYEQTIFLLRKEYEKMSSNYVYVVLTSDGYFLHVFESIEAAGKWYPLIKEMTEKDWRKDTLDRPFLRVGSEMLRRVLLHQ